MGYFIAKQPNTSAPGPVWLFEPSYVQPLDGSERITVGAGEDPLTCAQRVRPGWQFVALNLGPGEYYPRMARPTAMYVDSQLFEGSNPDAHFMPELRFIETARGQLTALKEQLQRIFRTVHPEGDNLEAFGHDVRNVLILAATEVRSPLEGNFSCTWLAVE
jgi:hypothetical protein